MEISTTSFRLIALSAIMLTISSATFAQRGRDRHYHSGYYAVRPHVSVGIGYRPYYGYRPAVRPHVYYRPAYRLPYRYLHYGPAFGFRINVLPFGYSGFFIGADPYYYYNGIYYRPYNSGGYTVVKPPLGANVKHLPTGAKATVIDGQKYFELGGTFYQERISADNKVTYEVVGTEGVLNTTNADADDEETTETPAPAEPSAKANTAPAPQVATNEATASTVSKLPEGCKPVTINDQKFYVSPDGTYYQEVVDGNNVTSYKIAGSSSAEPQQ